MAFLPMIAAAAQLLLPRLFRSGPRSLDRRPWAIGVVAAVVIVFLTLTVMGMRAPWSPAYDTEPFTAADLGVDDPDVLRGADAFYTRGCQFCHQVLGRGGFYGPDLTEVTARISPQEV